MQMFLIRTVVAAIVIGSVSGIAHRYPRMGAVLLTLPTISILAFLMTWLKDHDLENLQQLSRETLILVPLGLPFFVPLAFADRLGLGFWSAMSAGLVLAVITIGSWLLFAPATS
jgi:hypothetical protein